MLEKNKTGFTKKYVKWNNAHVFPETSKYIYIKAYGKEK